MQETHFTSHDGTELYRRTWPSEQPDAGAVVILHGFGEHCARYDALAERLNDEGFSVYSYDQRWHGRSPGHRGRISNFEILVKDLDAFLAHIATRVENRDAFILGHSMGGLLLATRLARGPLPFQAAIFSSPFLQIDEVPPVLTALSGILNLLAPWLPAAKLSTDSISRDPEVVAAYETDPLVHHGSIRLRTGLALQRAVSEARRNFAQISLPIYIIHGDGDKLVPHGGSELLYEDAVSEDKSLRLYEGGYHELFNDLDREKVINDLCAWISLHRKP